MRASGSREPSIARRPGVSPATPRRRAIGLAGRDKPAPRARKPHGAPRCGFDDAKVRRIGKRGNHGLLAGAVRSKGGVEFTNDEQPGMRLKNPRRNRRNIRRSPALSGRAFKLRSRRVISRIGPMARGPWERDEMRTLLCFARGHEGSWEGLCVDYDIAVQGASFGQVQADLAAAIADYVEAAMGEDQATSAKLLARRAPLRVRLMWTARILWTAWRRDADRDTSASFPVACPA
jgi:hypothetical protein